MRLIYLFFFLYIYSSAFSCDTAVPEFYGLPKILKANAPLRLAVAAFDDPLARISIIMERILNQLLRHVSPHLTNTQDAVDRLNGVFPDGNVPENVFIVTMDVVALYPSIQIEDGITAVLEKVKECQCSIDLLGFTPEDIASLLRFILNNNYFMFGDRVCHQTKDVSMGTHIASLLAIVFMDRLEKRILETAEVKPESYGDTWVTSYQYSSAEKLRHVSLLTIATPNIQVSHSHLKWRLSASQEPSWTLTSALESTGQYPMKCTKNHRIAV